MLRVALSQGFITPPAGISMLGFAAREQGAIGVHDDLTATALVIDDGHIRTAIVSCDLLYLHPTVVQQVRERIATQGRVPAHHVLFCCSHTHSGPICFADERSNQLDRAYVDSLIETLTRVVSAAAERLQPAQLAWGQGEAHIAVNRRQRRPDGTVMIGENLHGPVDRSVNVLRVHDASGDVVATLVNYACHPVLLGWNSRVISGDWPGVMRRVTEAVSGAPCLFIQGAAGDLNPRINWTENNWPDVERDGLAVAHEVNRVCGNLTDLPGTPAGLASSEIWLPLRDPSTVNPDIFVRDVGITLDEFKARQEADPSYPRAAALETRHGIIHTPIAVSALRLGDFGMATVAAEPFTQIGMDVKRGSPAPVNFFAGYTNGCNSYLPTAEEHSLGGYEVEVAPLFYGLPAGYTSNAAATVAAEAARLLSSLWI